MKRIRAYDEIIYEADARESKKERRAVTAFDSKGGVVSEGGIIPWGPRPKKRIAVRLGTDNVFILHAKENVAEHLSPRLFPTGEALAGEAGLQFGIDIRVSLHEDAEAIAKAHWHPDLLPHEYFFKSVAYELERRFEDSLEEFDGTVGERIARYRDTWQREIAQAVSSRFKIVAEIRLTADAVSSNPGVIIGTGDAPAFEVSFSDRIDRKFPLQLTLILEPTGGEGLLFPPEPEQRRRLLEDLIAAACREAVPLYDYWFDIASMERILKEKLGESLARYKRRPVQVSVDPARHDPPPSERRVTLQKSWRDELDLALTFYAVGHVRISRDGAGLYDRNSRRDLADWFTEAIEDELHAQLDGNTVLDVDERFLERLKRGIDEGISKRARAAGLQVDPFIGNPQSEYRDLTKTILVTVADREYATDHPEVKAEFSMDVEIRFQSLHGLRPFLERRQGHLSKDGLLEIVEEAVREKVRSKAELVMKTVSAHDYFVKFSSFKSLADWETGLSALEAPGWDRESGENKIERAVRDDLSEHFPGLDLVKITFHRTDSSIGKIARLISFLGPLEATARIEDRITFDAGKDRDVVVTLYFTEGDPEKLTLMLESGMAEMDTDTLTAQIKTAIEKVIRTRLSGRGSRTLDNLHTTLASGNVSAENTLRHLFDQELKNFVRENFGIRVRAIETEVKLSAYAEKVRSVQERTATAPLGIQEVAVQTDMLLYEKLNRRLLELDPTNAEDRKKAADIREELALIEGKRPSLPTGLADPEDTNRHYLAPPAGSPAEDLPARSPADPFAPAGQSGSEAEGDREGDDDYDLGADGA